MNDFELNTKLKIKSMWVCIALYAAGSLLSFFSIALGDVFVFLIGFFVWLFYMFLSEAIAVICIVSGVRQTVASKKHAPISDKPCNVLIPVFSILNMALFVAAFFIFPPTNNSRNGVSSLVITFIAMQIVYCVFDIIFLLRYRKYRRLCKASAPSMASTMAVTSAPTMAPVQPPISTPISTPVPPQPYIQAAPQKVPQQAPQQIPQYQQQNPIPQAVQSQVVPQPVQQPMSQPTAQPMQQQFPQAPVSPMGAPTDVVSGSGQYDIDFNEDNYSSF